MDQRQSEKRASFVIELRDVKKSFGSKKVLDGVSLSIKKGSFTCLCGSSGCGKTTVMNILAGYMKPDAGECLFEGKMVEGPDKDRLVVFQESALIPWLTLWENTLFGPKMLGKDISAAVGKAKELVNLSGLSGFENKYPSQLSGGMKRRAELIRALINEPKILLLDEPFRGLDAMTRDIMIEYFLDFFERTKITMLLITSNLDQAVFMGDSIYFMTKMPTRIKKEVLVNLSRPRVTDQQATSEFGKLVDNAYKIIEEEEGDRTLQF